MDVLKKYLNWAAGILILAALAAGMVWPYRKSLVLVLGAAGLLALVVHVLLHLDEFRQGFRRRSFIYSGNMILVVILVLAILVLANYFLARHTVMIDLTAGKVHSLSGQTLTVLKALKTDVSLKAFFRESNYGRGALENLLKLYAHSSPRIKYEFIDPDKNPGLVKRYDISQDGTTVIEAGDKEGRITTTTEEDLTNALIKATRAQKKVVYFLEGHGEGTIEETGDNGYSTAKSELEKLGYEVKKLTLVMAERFPADCALLVVPGPQKDLLPNEYESIKNYISSGGRCLFMVDPETQTLLPLLLADYGFKLDNDIVVDKVSRLVGGDYFMPVVVNYESHPITDKFNYYTFFPYARSIEAGEIKPDGATVTVLAKTSQGEGLGAGPSSWAERELDQKEVKFNPAKDREGPIGLAAVSVFKAKPAPETPPTAAEAKPEPRPEAAEKEVRIAVVGSSSFVKNHYYNYSGNGNFFLNIVNWLTEESDLIAIQPKTQAPRTLQLSPVRMSTLRLVVLYLLPFGVLALGVFIWVRRKSL
jgi:ABC-type uncharacterized transport system involved in gliding motility auxiliary subunit